MARPLATLCNGSYQSSHPALSTWRAQMHRTGMAGTRLPKALPIEGIQLLDMNIVDLEWNQRRNDG